MKSLSDSQRERRIFDSVRWQELLYQQENAIKIFDHTTIADRLRTVSWSNNSHSTGMVKPVNGYSTFPQKPCNQILFKRRHISQFVNNPAYIDWGPTANQS